MATSYQRGRAFEYRARDKALKLGASYVMRAASSKGAADLIVLWPKGSVQWSGDARISFPEVWLVQAKRDGKLPKAERVELLRIAEETGAAPILAKTGPNGRGVEFTYLDQQEC